MTADEWLIQNNRTLSEFPEKFNFVTNGIGDKTKEHSVIKRV